MNSITPLFAAGVDPELIKLAVVALIMLIAGIGKLMALTRPKPPIGGARVKPPQPISKDAADEIDEFLHRAVGQRGAEPRGDRPAQRSTARRSTARPASRPSRSCSTGEAANAAEPAADSR